MTAILSASAPWRYKFNHIDHAMLEQLLGFNPAIELIEDNSPDVIHQAGPTLYVHGWLSGKDAKNLRNRCNDSNKIPGDVVVFNFPDASHWIRQTIPYYMPISRSNFAQKNDIKTMLCVVKALHNAGIQIPVCYAHSRGGAVAKKSIGILNNPSDEWKKELEILGISVEDQEIILGALKVAYLETPLKNVDLVIRKDWESILAPLVYVCPSLKSFASETVPKFVKNNIFPVVTSFNPRDTREPIDYLKDWNNLNATVVLHFQHGDKKVPNDDDAECAKILLTAKPNNTHVIVGNDGGHDDGNKTISKVIHALNKSQNCSYLNTQKALSAGDQLLEKAATLNARNVEEYVHNAHAQFAQDNKKRQWSFASNACMASGFATLYSSISANSK
jgi:hypothetical protein